MSGRTCLKEWALGLGLHKLVCTDTYLLLRMLPLSFGLLNRLPLSLSGEIQVLSFLRDIIKSHFGFLIFGESPTSMMVVGFQLLCF